MKTRNQVIQQQSNGVRYFNSACVKAGRAAVVQKTLDLHRRFPDSWNKSNLNWALGNAVREILDSQGDIQQSYNLDEVLTEKELVSLEKASGLVRNQCWERKTDKAAPLTISDTSHLPAAPTALAGAYPGIPVSFADTTEGSVAAINTHIGLDPVKHQKDWKRIGKTSGPAGVARQFAHRKLGSKVEVVTGSSGCSVSANIEDLLRIKALGITHCGDCGQLFWNAASKTVWWTIADSDGGDKYTNSDEIEDMLKLPGVKEVVTGNEREPEDPGYKDLGQCGHTIVPMGL